MDLFNRSLKQRLAWMTWSNDLANMQANAYVRFYTRTHEAIRGPVEKFPENMAAAEAELRELLDRAKEIAGPMPSC